MAGALSSAEGCNRAPAWHAEWVDLFLVALIVGGLYASSWWLHPMRACNKCKGSSRHFGSWHKSKFRFCPKCQGRGREPRMGAKAMMGLGLMSNPERTGPGWRRANRP
jgi:hypothetical protein